MIFEIEDILAILPHRPPMLFLDRVENVRPAESGLGRKSVAWSGLKAGQTPSSFPRTFILEMLAQTAGVVCAAARSESNLAGDFGFLASIDASFHTPVRPQDPLQAEVTISRIWSGLIMFQGTVRAAGSLAAQARMSISAPSTRTQDRRSP